MSKKLDFEILEIPGREVLEKIRELSEKLPESRQYPFIIGEKRSLDLLTDFYDEGDDKASAIIAEAQALDARQIFERREKDALPIDEEFDREELTGIWEYRDSNRDIGLSWEDLTNSHTNILSRAPLENCLIGIAPTAQSWQVPAFVRFGNWNNCPAPVEHCAILKFWQEKYGAKLVSLTHDVIECSVENPPQTEEECRELAWQQFAYCADIVEQGVGTVGALASGLRDSSYWYFWWD